MSPVPAPSRASAQVLENWIRSAFAASGLAEGDAARAAGLLVQTSLWGVDSHGVARAPHYFERLARGSVKARPEMRFERTAAASGTLDADHGLGLIACDRAMGHAMELAREAGVGAVGVSESSHCGAIGLFTRRAAREGLVGIGFTHSDSFVAPHGGGKPFFGTNPISIALPSEPADRPLCVDMATSIVPWNRVMNARRENRPVPEGWGVDAEGKDCTDPHRIVALRPAAGHKGYALAFAIDMLCGPLNGMTYGPHLTPMYGELDRQRRLGSLMIALDPARFAGAGLLAAVVAMAAGEIREREPGVLCPGDPEYAEAELRGREGVPIEPGLLEEFSRWAGRLGLPGLDLLPDVP